MLIARALAGGLSGNVAVVSSMLSEMTDETNQGMGTSICSVKGIDQWNGWIGRIRHFGVFARLCPRAPGIQSIR